MTSRVRRRILEGSLPGAIAHLAWPLVVRFPIAVLIGMVPSFWLARSHGTLGLAVTAAVAPLEQIALNLFLAISIGGGSLLAIAVGRGQRVEASRIVASTAVLTLLFGASVSAVSLACVTPLADMLSGHLAIQADVRTYLVPLLCSLPLLGLTYVLLSTVTATGRTLFGLARLVIDLLLIAVLTPLFIGPLALGLAGPPVASLVGMLVLNGATWITFRRLSEELGLAPVGTRLGRIIEGNLWLRIVGVGAPIQTGRIAQFVANLVLLRLVTKAGAESSAGYGIAYRLIYIGSAILWAVARANAIVIGQASGAGRSDRALASFRTTVVFLLITCSILFLSTSFARPVLHLFSHDPAVIEAARDALGTMKWGLIGLGGSWLLADTYLATGETKLAGVFMVLSTGVGLGVAYGMGGPAIDRAGWGFSVQCLSQAALLALLVPASFLRPMRALAAPMRSDGTLP